MGARDDLCKEGRRLLGRSGAFDRFIRILGEQLHQVIKALSVAKMLALTPGNEFVGRADGDPCREAVRGFFNSPTALLQDLGWGTLDKSKAFSNLIDLTRRRC